MTLDGLHLLLIALIVLLLVIIYKQQRTLHKVNHDWAQLYIEERDRWWI